MLYSMQEIQAVLGLLNRTPMTQAELLFSKTFFERLVAFCTPPEPQSPETEPPDPEKEPEEPVKDLTSP